MEKMLETVYTAGKYISEDQVTEIQFQILKALQEHGTLTRNMFKCKICKRIYKK